MAGFGRKFSASRRKFCFVDGTLCCVLTWEARERTKILFKSVFQHKVSWQLEAKEYNKVTPCNKPYVSNLLGEKHRMADAFEWKERQQGAGQGEGFYRVFGACSLSEW